MSVHHADPGQLPIFNWRSAEIIEAYFPNVPKIELNCRGKPRPGWSAWGLEAEIEVSPFNRRHVFAAAWHPSTTILSCGYSLEREWKGMAEPLYIAYRVV